MAWGISATGTCRFTAHGRSHFAVRPLQAIHGHFYLDFWDLIEKSTRRPVDVVVIIQPGGLTHRVMGAVVAGLVSVATGRAVDSQAALVTGIFETTQPPESAVMAPVNVYDTERAPALLGSLKQVWGIDRVVITECLCKWFREQQRPHHVYLELQSALCVAEVVEQILTPKEQGRKGGIVRQGKAVSGLDLFTDALVRPMIRLMT